MNLTEPEKQEIIRFLEAGKPLPEKYRFLLFADKREVELVWNGKTSEVTTAVLPFQVIEQVDEPRSEKELKLQMDLFDNRGRQLRGWSNKLIWGDNKLILSSLKNGPLREEIESQGGIKLIYIDPPFDVGADFSINIEVGEESLTKQPSVLEELAYRDTWGKGADSFIAMIYERLSLMRDLLAEDGSIYVHCDWRVNSYIRLVLDEIFGKENWKSEIIWKRSTSKNDAKQGAKFFGRIHDTIHHYAKAKDNCLFNTVYEQYSDEYLDSTYSKVDDNGKRFKTSDLSAAKPGGNTSYLWKGCPPPKGRYWAFSYENMEKFEKDNLIYYSDTGKPYLKQYLDEMPGVSLTDLWIDFPGVTIKSERLDYPTQKPEALLERIIKASSNPGDLVADFFCGSGTTLAAAEKLGRKWLGSDLGKFAVHTARKRLIGVQRELKKAGADYRAFEILNLGKYERQHYIGVNSNLRDEEKARQVAEKEQKFLELILSAYQAQKVDGFKTFHGKKAARLVAVGPVNLPVSRRYVEEILAEGREKQITKVDILAFEFEMGLFPKIQEDAKALGIDLALKYIPREVFDKRAVEKNQVVFHDVSYIEIKPILKKNLLAIELTDFSVFYHQDSIREAESTLKNGGKKLVVENGQIIKVEKDKDGIVSREVLTKKWSDWIDYWAIDFDFESKKEILRIKNEKGETEEVWSGDYVFENEWQSFRTKKDRKLELVSTAREMPAGRVKIAVKVVDIFGNDTMKVIEVNI